MIRKLVLENFMAHARTEVALGPGMTVLTGPNNIGKSALVEAIRCLATNPAPKAQIRHGAKEARVEAHVEDEDGQVTVVAWVRHKNWAKYEILQPGAEEPEVFAKLGKSGVPDEVRAALRLDPVALETGQDVDVHIGNQREPIFLLNLPPSNAAAFFAASTESAHLLAMQDVLKNRVREAKREERDLSGRMAGLETDLDALSGLPDLTLAVERAVEQEREIQEKERVLPPLADLLQGLENLSSAAGRATERGKALAALVPPAEPALVRGLVQTMENMAQLESDLQGLSARQHGLSTLTGPPKIAEVKDLARVAADLSRLSAQAGRLEQRAGRLNDMQESPACLSTGPLSEIIGELSAVEQSCASKSSRLQQIQDQRAALEQEIEDRLAGLDQCPLCGSHMDKDAFLGRGKD